MQNSDFLNRITSFYGFQPSSVVLCVENSDFRTKIACLYGSKTSLVILCKQNSVPSIRITSLYESQPSSVVFGCKTATLGPDFKCVWVPALVCGFCMQNSGFWTQIANLYWSQISRVVLCLQSSMISSRTTCLYGSQPFSVVFEYKTATFGAELQVCMGPRRHLSFCACKSAWLAP